MPLGPCCKRKGGLCAEQGASRLKEEYCLTQGPGNFEGLIDFRTKSSSSMQNGLQLIGSVSESRWLKKGCVRSGEGSSNPRSDLKCSNQMFSHCRLHSGATRYDAVINEK